MANRKIRVAVEHNHIASAIFGSRGTWKEKMKKGKLNGWEARGDMRGTRFPAILHSTMDGKEKKGYRKPEDRDQRP